MQPIGPSLTIAEWCELRHVSIAKFWKDKKAGTGVRTYREGRGVRISPQADAEYLARKEAEGAGTYTLSEEARKKIIEGVRKGRARVNAERKSAAKREAAA